MKLNPIPSLCVLALGLTVAQAQEVKIVPPGQSAAGANPAAAAAPALKLTDVQLSEELGWFLAKRSGIGALEFSKEEVEGIIKGVRSAAEGKDAPYDPQSTMPALQDMMQKKEAAYSKVMEEKMRPQIEAAKKKSAEESEAFFAKLKDNKNVVETPSGLRYEIVKPGTGPSPKPEDTIKVHYVGSLLNGEEFDSSVKRGTPLDIGLSEVVPGWTEGIQKINKGGKIKLYIPAKLGYGDEGNERIPPGATLVFDVELIDFTPAPAAAPAPAMPTPAPATK